MRIENRGRLAALGLVCLEGALAAACGGARSEVLVFRAPRVEIAPATFAGSARVVLDAARAYPAPGGDRAAPVSLTASDGTGLRLVELDARAAVEGPLAFTELHLTFENPEERTLEGRFALELPAGAAVTRLAMSIDGAWHESEVAPIVRGREAYESTMHRRVDPALAELAPDGRLVARVFPIPARGRKQLIVSYVHELRAHGAAYRLPLDGLPVVERLRVNVAIGGRVVRMAEDGRAPAADFEAAVAGPDAAVGLRADGLAVVRLAPLVGGAAEPMPALTILFDTSASRVWRFRRDALRLDALARALGERFGGELPLRVIAFDQSVETVFDGRAGGWDQAAVDRLLLRRPLGASNLAGALAHAAGARRRGRLLVWSDLIATAGASSPAELAAAVAGATAFERVDVMLADGGQDGERLARRLVSGLRGQGGVVLRPELAPEEIARRLALRAVSGVKLSVPGARWVYPARLDGVQDGDELLVYAAFDAGAAPEDGAPLALVLSGALDARHELTLAPAPAPLLAAAHAAARLNELEARGDDARAEIIELSSRSHVLSRRTAFVVLESDADYARLGIARRAPGELLVVGRSGLRVVPRRVAPWPVDKPRRDARRAGPASVRGTVVDRASGAPVPDVTVVATSPALLGSATELTDPQGAYRLERLPEGDYELTFYYGEVLVRTRTRVSAGGDARADAAIDSTRGGEVVAIEQPAPTVDAGAHRSGLVLSGTSRSENTRLAADPGGARGGAPEPGVVASVPPAAATTAPPAAEDAPVLEPRPESQTADDALAAAVARHAARPDDPVALRTLGEALVARGKTALAARVYGSLLDLYPARADMWRVAGQWLEPLGGTGADLALDAYARALHDRPDHATGYRMAAFALARRGRPAEAFELASRALTVRFPAGRFAGFTEVLRQDLGVLGAAWAAAEPARRAAIEQRVARLGGSLERAPSLRIVLTWETDASDVDLHVFDEAGHEASARAPTLPDYGGTLLADVDNGYGPEAFVIDSPDAFPYRVEVHVQDRGATGLVLGRVQIVGHDGRGRLSFDDRPFAAAAHQLVVDLGRIDSRRSASPSPAAHATRSHGSKVVPSAVDATAPRESEAPASW